MKNVTLQTSRNEETGEVRVKLGCPFFAQHIVSANSVITFSEMIAEVKQELFRDLAREITKGIRPQVEKLRTLAKGFTGRHSVGSRHSLELAVYEAICELEAGLSDPYVVLPEKK